MNKNVFLKNYDNSWYKPGPAWKKALWYLCSLLFIRTSLPYPSGFKRSILRLFGAEIGRKVVLKPGVRIKYPWFLSIGDFCWIGEDVWIDNLAQVSLESDTVLSQGVYVLTGNHDYKSESFDLLVKPVVLKHGSWAGAKSILAPGTVLAAHSVLSAGAVLTKATEEYGIYQGNPAVFVRKRTIL